MYIKWNMRGFRELRFDPAVKAEILARGERMAAAAGDGYVADPYDGRNRPRVSVRTDNFAAMRDNAKNNTLLRSINAGAN